MVRYMMYMSYIGSRYRGAQKQMGCEKLIDPDSIQGAVEASLLTVIPHSICRPSLTLSSRTDSGVHALCSTAHVELVNEDDTTYDTESVLKQINRFLTRGGHEIRVTSFFPVKDTFHARFAAQSRTYMYRLMCPKKDGKVKLPIAELGRAWNVNESKFDIEKVEAATRLFMGVKNFMTFSGKNREDRVLQYVRRLNELRIEDGEPLMSMDPLAKDFRYWNVICSSRSFLYNQVRRIVAALVGIGYGVITEKDINIMLHVPSLQSWSPKIPVAPPHGLYLKEVTYDPVELAVKRLYVSQYAMDLLARIEARKKSLKATRTLLTSETGERYEIFEGIERKLNEKRLPFVVDDKPDMEIAQISRGLFLSSQDPATCEKTLKIHRIRHVLSLGVGIAHKHEGVSYYYVDFLDLPEFDITAVLEESFCIINKCRKDNVLVHCNAGVSRSATIVIAYLMVFEGLNYAEAHARVKRQRECIRPNDGFVRQLKELRMAYQWQNQFEILKDTKLRRRFSRDLVDDEG